MAIDWRTACLFSVVAHKADLAFAAGHGMQTAFVARPMEFGGAVSA